LYGAIVGHLRSLKGNLHGISDQNSLSYSCSFIKDFTRSPFTIRLALRVLYLPSVTHSFLLHSSHWLLFKMNAIRGYFQPAAKKPSKKPTRKSRDAKPAVVNPVREMRATAPIESETSTPTRSPLTSRPSSIFPSGDFRNAPRESVLDTRADVMVSWLEQQQQEKLWSKSMEGEGVVLKKSKDNFTCCPETLKTDSIGLFRSVVAMNVRVSLQAHLFDVVC